jgi:transcriptional regulator with XRE-family HTH domain
MTYGEAIKKLRRKMILTQTELAELLKVTFGTVNRWESGKFEPTTKTKRKLQLLFEEFGINLED